MFNSKKVSLFFREQPRAETARDSYFLNDRFCGYNLNDLTDSFGAYINQPLEVLPSKTTFKKERRTDNIAWKASYYFAFYVETGFLYAMMHALNPEKTIKHCMELLDEMLNAIFNAWQCNNFYTQQNLLDEKISDFYKFVLDFGYPDNQAQRKEVIDYHTQVMVIVMSSLGSIVRAKYDWMVDHQPQNRFSSILSFMTPSNKVPDINRVLKNILDIFDHQGSFKIQDVRRQITYLLKNKHSLEKIVRKSFSGSKLASIREVFLTTLRRVNDLARTHAVSFDVDLDDCIKRKRLGCF